MANSLADKGEDFPFVPVDPLLQYVVSLANEAGISIPVTLMVKGMVITGSVINKDKYYNKLISIFGDPAIFINSVDGKSARLFADHFIKVLTTFKDPSNDPNNLAEKPKPFLIHLENVQIIDIPTGRQIEMKDGLWRGRIDTIDGFIFGNP